MTPGASCRCGRALCLPASPTVCSPVSAGTRPSACTSAQPPRSIAKGTTGRASTTRPSANSPSPTAGRRTPGNPIAWNRYAYIYNAPVHYTESSGHFIDTLWDVVDLAADALNCLGDSDTLACYMLVPDALALAVPFVPGVADNAVKAARRASKVDELSGARRVIVELGSGDFANLVHIAEDNTGIRVVGIEHPDLRPLVETALADPMVLQGLENTPGYAHYAMMVENIKGAETLGAEVMFFDFGKGLHFKADEIITIAPNPSSAGDVVIATKAIRPGGRIYIATVPREQTRRNLARYLSSQHGINIPPPRLGTPRYPSSDFPGRLEIIDFIVP